MSTTTTQTIAEQIAATVDPATWRTEDGIHLSDVCEERGGQATYAASHYDGDADRTRYSTACAREDYGIVRVEFDDGSAIVMAEDVWDIEHPTERWTFAMGVTAAELAAAE